MYLIRTLLLFSILCTISVHCCQSRWRPPRLEFSPQPNSDSTLIWVRPDNAKSVRSWTTELERFLKPYTNRDIHLDVQICEDNENPQTGKVCEVKLQPFWAPCLPDYDYGYSTGNPCVFLRMTDISKWTPKYYIDEKHLPRSMPEDLQNYIKTVEQRDGKTSVVWVSCNGENPADKENIGPIFYYPKKGFDGKYFPIPDATKEYQNPVVAVFFQKPQRGVVINIECRVWNPNVEYDSEKGNGMVHFQLLVD